jgi:hypothetical protein
MNRHNHEQCMNLRIKKLQFVTIYDVTREKVIQKLTFAIITIAIYLSWLTHLSFKDAREMAGLVVMGEDRKNCMLNRREDVQNWPLK